jgi:hypothetical protein
MTKTKTHIRHRKGCMTKTETDKILEYYSGMGKQWADRIRETLNTFPMTKGEMEVFRKHWKELLTDSIQEVREEELGKMITGRCFARQPKVKSDYER